MKLSKQSYKVFLERYAETDIEKTSLTENTIVIATIGRRGDYVDKEVCRFKGYDSGIPLLENYYTKEEYRVPLEDIIVPVEKKLTQMWSRMSNAMTNVDSKFNWLQLIKEFGFVPAGRIMTMLGTPYQDKLTSDNCYVLPCPKDSRKGIIRDTQYEMTELMSRGGGVGLGIYSLRPRNAVVRGVNGTSSGSVSWGGLLSYQTGLVEQGGCLTPDTLVNTENGLQYLSEIVTHEKGWVDHNLMIPTPDGNKLSTGAYNNGIADTLHITTTDGIEIIGTYNHKIKVLSKDNKMIWKTLDELTINDHLNVQLDTHMGQDIIELQKPDGRYKAETDVVLPKYLDEEFAFLLGCMTSCKYFINGIFSLAIPNTSYLINKMEDMLHNMFGNINISIMSTINDTVYNFASDKIQQFFIANDLIIDAVPKIIRTANRNIVSSYIAGIFEISGELRECCPFLNTKSKQLAHEIQTLLIGLGCITYVHEDIDKKLYNVSIETSSGITKWETWIKPYIDSRSKLYNTDKENPYVEYIPAINNTYLSKITKIEQAGQQLTLDLEVEDNHTYIANGIVTHNSRRGALMLIQMIWHPDIYEFIHAKEVDGKIENANLSVGVTEAFMEILKNDGDWKLEFPDTSYSAYDTEWDGNLAKWKVKGYPVNLYKTVKARDLWNEIMGLAWASGEPGVVFLERMNNYNNLKGHYDVVATNPCVSGDTLILTDEGYIQIKDRIDIPTNIWNGYEYSEVIPKVTGTNQEMLKIGFSNGLDLTCTKYHKFILADGNRIEAKDLKLEDKLIKHDFPIISGTLTMSADPYTQGFYAGDGTYNTSKKEHRLYLYDEKINLMHHFEYHNDFDQRETNKRWCLILKNHMYDRNFVPDNKYTIENRLGWFAGLLDSDGYKTKDNNIQIESIDKDFLINVKLMLNTLGCHGKIVKSHNAEFKMMPDQHGGHKEYATKETHRLLLSVIDLSKLVEMGLKTHRIDISNINPNRDASRFIAVTSISIEENASTVYCFNEPKNHSGIFNGILTANCGEQPLHAYGVCNLGHIHMGIIPYMDGDIDYEYLKEKIIGAVRFLDNMIDINKYFLDKNKEVQLLVRRIGLGTLGIGEALINLEIRYGNAKCIKVLDKIYKFIRDTAYAASVELAKERGPFPAWETVKESYLQSPFILALPKQLQKDIATYGIRNSTILTQAPTGSTGTMVGTSTGIEPYFAFEYTQTTNLGTEKIRVRQYDEWVKAHPDQDLPSYFVTAMEITPEEHIAVQAVIQKYVDSSISKTINLPKKTTKEEVAHLYELAYDKGCKGLTLYREGSKEFAPLQIEEKKSEVALPATKQWGYCRPKSKKTPSETFSLMTGCGTLYLTVTYDPNEGRIYETFLSKGSTGGCREYMTATSRMTSKALRSGVPIEDVIEQLMSGHPCPSYLRRKLNIGDTDQGLNCPQAIAYKLKDLNEELKKGIVHHITPNSVEYAQQLTGLCPECGNPLPHEGGCTTCRNCGYSGCS